jgi:hypothetical protein
MVYGQSTGLSPVAVITSATFWTWLWGPIGLVLATPLTMCLVVLGRHVDRLKFLDVMFGDKPPLKPEELVYQRLLAGDPMEAAEQAQQYLKDKSLLSYYQDVLVEGLKLAQADADKGLLDDERTLRIRDTVAEIVDDLEARDDTTAPVPQEPPAGSLPLPVEEKAQPEPQVPEEWRDAKRVLCIPGLGQLDEAVALVVAQLVAKQGIGARAEGSGALSISRIFTLDTDDVAIVCICYIENATSAQIRYATRRLRRKVPNAFIITALVGNEDADANPVELSGGNSESVQRSLEGTVKRIREIAVNSRRVPQLTAA